LRIPSIGPSFIFAARPVLSRVKTMDAPVVVKNESALEA
jgi:hypothetical protein